MATLNIFIKGIALVHKENAQWKLYLPFDTCHQVYLGFFIGDKRYLLKGANRQIMITARDKNGRVASGGPSTGSNYDSIFNIAEDAAHKKGVYLLGGMARKTAILTVNGGKYSASKTEHEYALYRKDGTHVTSLGKIGQLGKIIIQGDTFQIAVGGGARVEGFPIELAHDATVVIDNDCDGTKKGNKKPRNNDFHLLYENVLRNKDCDALEFKVMRDTRKKSNKGMTEEEMEALPCNNFRVGKVLGVEPAPCPKKPK